MQQKTHYPNRDILHKEILHDTPGALLSKFKQACLFTCWLNSKLTANTVPNKIKIKSS